MYIKPQGFRSTVAVLAVYESSKYINRVQTNNRVFDNGILKQIKNVYIMMDRFKFRVE